MPQLDEAQRAAIEAEGAILIVAPPGSGKTRTLVERIKRLIENGAKPERILALTFTNKAANEMRDRLATQIPRSDLSIPRSDLGMPYCGTFHALALEMLRTHGDLIGLQTNFEIVSEDERRKKNDAEDFMIYHKIEHFLTFDELLSCSLRLLEEVPEARAHWQNRFDHILVDEYQDTDDRQERMLAILAEPQGNLCVIGDPEQAIYGFRGANVQNFLEFTSRYPAARQIELSTNYRSTPTLVAAAQNFISAPVGHRMSHIHAGREDSGEKITLKECLSPAGEAHWIVKEIEKLVGSLYHESGAREGAYQPGDIAVLYRFNAIGREFVKHFAEAGIPYVLVNEQNIDEIQFDTFRVPLMTMHAAKGLEFPVVFMAGLEDGVIPSFQFDDAPEDERVAEEKRLFYVAMTRAKDRLFLSHAKNRTLFGKTYSDLSRFIRNIPIEHISVEEKEKPRVFQKKLF